MVLQVIKMIKKRKTTIENGVFHLGIAIDKTGMCIFFGRTTVDFDFIHLR